jgi:hypothetical protein
MIEYKGLDSSFIEEYCNDRLDAKEHIRQIVRLSMLFDQFNFDMLKALVEEMNRYKETPNQALEILNAKPTDNGESKHNITVYVGGKELTENQYWPNSTRCNPLSSDDIDVDIDLDPEDENSDRTCHRIRQSHLKNIDVDAGTYTYVLNEASAKNIVLVFTRENKTKRGYNWLDAF